MRTADAMRMYWKITSNAVEAQKHQSKIFIILLLSRYADLGTYLLQQRTYQQPNIGISRYISISIISNHIAYQHMHVYVSTNITCQS